MWIFIVFNYQKWPMLVWVSSRWGVGSRFCDVIFFSANAIKRLINNEWRSFVFEKSLNCRNEMTNIVIFKRIKAQVLANKPAHFWTGFFPLKMSTKICWKLDLYYNVNNKPFWAGILSELSRKRPLGSKNLGKYIWNCTHLQKKKTSALKNSRLITKFL